MFFQRGVILMVFLLYFLLSSSLLCASDGEKKLMIIKNETDSEMQLVHPQDNEFLINLGSGQRFEFEMVPQSLKSLMCYTLSSQNDELVLLRADNIMLTDATEISITNEKDFERIFLATSLVKAKKQNRAADVRRSLTRRVSIEILKYAMRQVDDKN